MNTLAYIVLGILTERFHDHLRMPNHITSGWYSLSAVWHRVEELGHEHTFEEISLAFSALVEARLIEKSGDFLYCLRVTRIEYPKSA